MPARLELGLSNPLLVRREILELGLGLQLLYISDIHLRPGNQSRLISELWNAYQESSPDIVLLGGDHADHPACLEPLAELLVQFGRKSLVGAVYGNHDVLLGRERVKETITRAGVRWLPDAPVDWRGLQLLGSAEQYVAGQPAVLCSHYPTDFPQAIAAGVDAVFAGHLHGWQIVVGQWGEYLYPGAWLSRWNGLRFQRERSVMLVSRGVTDLFPLRWNCPREVILATL
jgi:predicted MPP superfamily phosphohydrolase